MIGYYIHHVGMGHLHRALAVAPHLDDTVTALSSLPADPRWPGPWVVLTRDDTEPQPRDPTAAGALHWAPLHDPGLQGRMRQIADWLEQQRPSVMVVDLSVEVLTLVRLLGVPVVAVTLPGTRDDPPHGLGFALAEAIVAPWPAAYGQELAPALAKYRGKVSYVGAISRFDGRRRTSTPATGSHRRRALVMAGTGGTWSDGGPEVRPAEVSGWDCTFIGPHNWQPDPWPQMCAADVIVSHAGLGALADIAAARRPTVVIPQPRPHDEQVTTGRALARAGLATVARRLPQHATEWSRLLEAARNLSGDAWADWSTGAGGLRMAEVVHAVRAR